MVSQFYHSIAARGEDIEEVLRRAEREEDEEEFGDGESGENGTVGKGADMKDEEGEKEDGEMEDGELEDGDVEDGEVQPDEQRDSGIGMIGPQLPRASGQTVPDSKGDEQDRPEANAPSAGIGKVTNGVWR